jgi:exosortase
VPLVATADSLHVKGNRTAASALVLLAGVSWLYRDVLWSLARQRASDDKNTHGLLIITLALYCAWERRAGLMREERKPSAAGLILVLLSLLVFAMGRLGAELFLARISLVGVIVGAVWFVWGSGHVRRLAFPLALLPLMVPLPAIVFNQIALPLQLIASRVGEATIAAAGIPVLREGNILELPDMTLAVAEACSGIRSLVSLVTLAIVLTYFLGRGVGGRIAVVASAVPIAILANAARVAGTGLAAHWIGRGAAEGFFHGFSGWLMFVTACAGLVGVQAFVNRIREAPPRRALEERCSPAR